jgi:serine/threonine protein kinase
MLKGDDIKLLLEARRLGLLTASDASRCLHAIVEAERDGMPLDVIRFLAETTDISTAKLEKLRKKDKASKSSTGKSSKSNMGTAKAAKRRAPAPAGATGDVQILLAARRLGFLSAAEVDQCLLWMVEAQKRAGSVDLKRILVSKNLLTPSQLVRLEHAHHFPRPPSSQGTDLSSTVHFPLPGEWLGDYWLLRELARGTTGILYEAMRRGAGHGTLALKLFAPPRGPSPRVLKRFRHEAALAAALQHPNIIKIHEVSRDRGYDFIVMDYFQGRSLAHTLRTKGITPKRAVKIVATCARAAHYMHGRGVVHRDLKPGNIMVGKGKVCIVDFGLAKDAERGEVALTNQGELLGTPAYMAPEQARGEIDKIGPWTDVFALGATLYRAIAGIYHFHADTLYEAISAVAEGRWEPLRVKRRDLPQDLCNVVSASMSYEAKDRPSASVFAHGLVKVLKRHELDLPAAPPYDEA